MIGPNCSGLIAAGIMTAQPAWQFPITQGLPSPLGWRAMTLSMKAACARDVLDRLPGHGIGQETDDIAGVPGLHGHADLAVGLEPAEARSAPADSDRPSELMAVTDQLGVVVEDMRRGLRDVLFVLQAAPRQRFEEQDPALPGIGGMGSSVGQDIRRFLDDVAGHHDCEGWAAATWPPADSGVRAGRPD